MTTPWGGTVAPGLSPVLDAFRRLLDEGDETGAAFCVTVEGRAVVDVWGGWADVARTRPWQPDTLVQTFSVSKPFAAAAVLLLAGRAVLHLDDPVAVHWPEFGTAGKVRTTVRQLLAHQAGLPAFAPDTDGLLLDSAALRTALAGSAPEWEPGTAHGEHALTYGHLLDGVVRGASGASLGELFDVEVAAPLGLDAHFGLPAAHHARIAELEYANPTWPEEVRGDPGTPKHRALSHPAGALDVRMLNSTAWRSAQFPAIGLHATAHAVARFYDGLLAPDGAVARLLGAQLHAQMLRPHTTGIDRVLGREVTWGLGPQFDDGEVGMGGIGGSLGAAVPDRGYAVRLRDPTARRPRAGHPPPRRARPLSRGLTGYPRGVWYRHEHPHPPRRAHSTRNPSADVRLPRGDAAARDTRRHVVPHPSGGLRNPPLPHRLRHR